MSYRVRPCLQARPNNFPNMKDGSECNQGQNLRSTPASKRSTKPSVGLDNHRASKGPKPGAANQPSSSAITKREAHQKERNKKAQQSDSNTFGVKYIE
ncbi:Cyclic nucleotide-gated olfactory channel [Dissostichus eleginoides]|uniref:Cyclic nucleotide-gated olfactory channel n=1 Tax=Dissostichus eleginoides TaxID=100907 RepID=A0AAD9B440_DISEL|nr:Cyclic nucleotide-gated olfactory channel [Dissostichus eleginoides]